MNGKNIFILVFILAAIFIFAYKKIARKQIFRGRKPMSFEEIYNTHIKNHSIKYETFEEIYKKLGDSYSVNPQLIRPTDSMKMFFDIDSLDLNMGTEKMEKWLVETLKMKNPKKEIKTVLDLLILAEGK